MLGEMPSASTVHLPCIDSDLKKFWVSYSFYSPYDPILERYIRLLTAVKFIPNLNRDMYVCFSKKEILLLEEFAKKKGALNISQLLESQLKDRKK